MKTTKFKRILSALMAALIVFTMVPYVAPEVKAAEMTGESPRLVAESVVKTPGTGTDVSVNLSIENNPGISEFSIVIYYYSAELTWGKSINYENCLCNEINGDYNPRGASLNSIKDYIPEDIRNYVKGFVFDFNKDSKYDPNVNIVDDGVLVNIPFTIIATDLGAFEYNVVVKDAYDIDGNPITFENVSGTISYIECEHQQTEEKHLDPTCGDTGYDRVVCSDCGYVVSETVISATGDHTPGDEATCTAAQVCTVCQKEIKPALGHTDGEIIKIDPSCSGEGFLWVFCSVCKKQITEKTEVTPPTGEHIESDGPTCTMPKYCTVCQTIIEYAHGHTYSDGSCIYCGEIYTKSGTTGDCTWVLTGTSLVISGNGRMADYTRTSPFSGYYITNVTFDDGVTYIGKYSFRNCTNLKSVKLPSGLISIGSYAFSGCSGLETVDLSECMSLESISSYAFNGCNSINTVNIGDLASFCRISFQDTTLLIVANKLLNGEPITTLVIPDGVECIPERAFYGCTSITEIKIPDGVTSIGAYAFYGCTSITEIKIPAGVTSIGQYAFYNCSNLVSVELPASIKSIYEYAFANCTSLENIDISDGITTIGSRAFGNCTSLKNVDLSDRASLESIEPSVFSGCTSLENVDLSGCTSLEYIDSYSFFNCTSLVSVDLSDCTSLIFADDYAFSGCTSLESLDISGCVLFCDLGADVFKNCEKFNTVYVSDIEDWLGLEFAYSTDNILYYAKNLYVDGKLLTELVIPEGTERIGNYAFYGCESIKSVKFPESIKSIGTSAFSGCKGIETVDMSACTSLTGIDDYVFGNCENLVSVKFPENLTSIGNSAFINCKSLESIDIPTGVTSIGSSAFEECTSLEYVDMSECTLLTSISGYVFYGCESLASVEIPDGVTSIGESAFFGCTNLVNAVIAESVTNIELYAFRNCTYLTDVYFKGTEENKPSVKVGRGDTVLSNAEWHYEAKLTDVTENQCTGELVKVYECVDGHTLQIVKPGSGGEHTPRAEHTITEPTCGANGYDRIICDICGDVIEETVIEATGLHIPDGPVFCTRDQLCSVCGNVIVPALGYHDSDHTAAGDEDPLCTRCGEPLVLTEGIEYYIQSDGTVVIEAYTGSAPKVYIPSEIEGCPVVAIESFAFADCTHITTIVLPNTLVGISGCAFSGCTSLSSIILPESLEMLEGSAFKECTSLVSLNIPQNVCYIGEGLGGGCDSLTSLTVDDGNPIYHDSGNCIIHTEDKYLLSGCSNSIIPADGSVIKIGDFAFSGCTGLESISIPEGVTSIGSAAFKECTGLVTVEIPDSVTSIAGFAFSGCTSLESIDISCNLEQIYSSSFENTAYYNDPSNWTDDVLYCDGALLKANCDNISGEFAVKEGTLIIATYALDTFCDSTNMTIPAGTIVCSNVFDIVDRLGNGVSVNVETLTLGSGVVLNENAFKSCIMVEVIFCDGTTEIGDYAFYDCRIYRVILPSTLKRIGDYAFYNCENLYEISFPAGLEEIGDYAFQNCYLYFLEGLPENLKEIGDYAFYNTHISRENGMLTIPEGVTHIGNYAFYGCTEIRDLSLSWDLEAIGERAFANCVNIGYISVYPNLKTVGASAFDVGSAEIGRIVDIIDIDSWSQIEFANATANPLYRRLTKSISTVNSVLRINGKTVTDVVISGEADKIGDYVFYGYNYLESVTIEEGVAEIGDYAFYGCSNLSELNISSTVESIGDSAFGGVQRADVTRSIYISNLKAFCENGNFIGQWTYRNGFYLYVDGELISDLVIPEGTTRVAPGTFYGCLNLTGWVDIPDSVTSIGDGAFEETEIWGVTIPASVTDIGADVFSGCQNLRALVFEEGITEIGYLLFGYDGGWLINIEIAFIPESLDPDSFKNMFAENYLPRYILYPGSAEEWNEKGYFDGFDDHSLNFTTLRSDVLYVDSGLCLVTGEDGNYKVDRYVGAAKDYVIPEEINGIPITTIGINAFSECWTLESVTVPESVTVIEAGAFSGCKNLVSIELTDNVTTLSTYAFADCTSLESFTVPSKITVLEDYLFYRCSSLKEIVWPDRLEVIGDLAFAGCDSFETINIPETVTRIDSGAFMDCYGIEEIVIPNSVTYIGIVAFLRCTSLKSIYIPASVTVLGDEPQLYDDPYTVHVLYGCTSLESVIIDDANPIYHADGNCIIRTADKYLLAGFENSSIPDDGSVTVIGEGAFAELTYLRSISIPDDITEIQDGAFYDCKNLISVDLSRCNNLKYIGDEVFRGCSALERIIFPSSLESIGEGAFFGCTSLTNINLAYCNNLTSIGISAFSGCSSLEGISVPSSITSIGQGAFSGCASLTRIDLSHCNNLTCIEDNTFRHCRMLESIKIPSSVESINYAFYECTALTTVYYGGTEEQWEDINIGKDGNTYLLNANIIFTREAVSDDNEIGASFYNDVLPENAVFNAFIKTEEDGGNFKVDIEGMNNETAVTYELNFTVDDVEVQPSGRVKVALPIPEGFDPEKTRVYHVDDEGNTVDMNAWIEGDKIVFETDHFSLYSVIEEIDEPEVPDYILGDIDGNGMVNAMDVNTLQRIVTGIFEPTEHQYLSADMTGDGIVNAVDANVLKRTIAGS